MIFYITESAVIQLDLVSSTEAYRYVPLYAVALERLFLFKYSIQGQKSAVLSQTLRVRVYGELRGTHSISGSICIQINLSIKHNSTR